MKVCNYWHFNDMHFGGVKYFSSKKESLAFWGQSCRCQRVFSVAQIHRASLEKDKTKLESKQLSLKYKCTNFHLREERFWRFDTVKNEFSLFLTRQIHLSFATDCSHNNIHIWPLCHVLNLLISVLFWAFPFIIYDRKPTKAFLSPQRHKVQAR